MRAKNEREKNSEATVKKVIEAAVPRAVKRKREEIEKKGLDVDVEFLKKIVDLGINWESRFLAEEIEVEIDKAGMDPITEGDYQIAEKIFTEAMMVAIEE